MSLKDDSLSFTPRGAVLKAVDEFWQQHQYGPGPYNIQQMTGLEGWLLETIIDDLVAEGLLVRVQPYGFQKRQR